MKSELEPDVASFALFAQSFDTLSEAEHFLRPTPEKAKDLPPRKICVGHEGITDISPIKLEGSIACDRVKPSVGATGQFGPRPEPVIFAPMPYPSHQEYRQPHQHRLQPQPPIYNAKGYSSTASNPFFVLRTVARAFDSFAYKLSCLYEADICPVNMSVHSSAFRRYPNGRGIDYRDLEKACCRVETALYAFGGFTTTGPPSPFSSIFRNRKSDGNEYNDRTVHERYSVPGDHVYWELENSPPVRDSEKPWPGRASEPLPPHSAFQEERDAPPSPGVSASSSIVPVDSQQKMRYRCKLCHQLKQNHECPYRKSLHRSIGVTVHAAVNAFTAAEPGRLAPPLSEMNSCVPFSEDTMGYPEDPSPDHTREISTPHISPDNTQTRLLPYSPQSSLSTDSGLRKHVAPTRSHRPSVAQQQGSGQRSREKTVFVETIDLKPEQFRIVTSSSKLVDSANAFLYPSVPLPLAQRKRLSDTLFALARLIPRLNEECAELLRRARGNNDWDLCVAQLLCQLVVGLYCAEGDDRLDGLKHYLLRMGIAC